jgi:hypothetical protein
MVWCRANNGAYKLAVSLILWLLRFTNHISCASYGSSMLLALRRDGKTTMPNIRQGFIRFIVVHNTHIGPPSSNGSREFGKRVQELSINDQSNYITNSLRSPTKLENLAQNNFYRDAIFPIIWYRK